jgi:hypothetical protein
VCVCVCVCVCLAEVGSKCKPGVIRGEGESQVVSFSTR